MDFDGIGDDEVGCFGFPPLASKTNSKKRDSKKGVGSKNTGKGAIANKLRFGWKGSANATVNVGSESNANSITLRCNGMPAVGSSGNGKISSFKEGMDGNNGDKLKDDSPGYITTTVTSSVGCGRVNCNSNEDNNTDENRKKTNKISPFPSTIYDDDENDDDGNYNLPLAHLLATSKTSSKDENNEATTLPSKRKQLEKSDAFYSSSNSPSFREAMSTSESTSAAGTSAGLKQSKSTNPQESKPSSRKRNRSSEKGEGTTSISKNKRQMGLQSYLFKTVTASESSNTSSKSSSLTKNTTESSTSTTSKDSVSSRQSEPASNNGQHSFVSAAELLVHPMKDLCGGSEKYFEKVEVATINSNDTLQRGNPLDATKQGEVRNDDFLEDDESVISDEVDSINTVVEKIDEQLSKDSGSSSADVQYNERKTSHEVLSKEKEQRRVLRRKARRSHNEKIFGIHGIVFGCSYPSQIVSETSGFKSCGDSEVQQQQQHLTAETSNKKPLTLDKFLAPRQDCSLNRHHSYNLLRGTSGMNILSHLFQRSYISSRKSDAAGRSFRHSNNSHDTAQCGRDLHRYVNAGMHWNISQTVKLSSANGNSEVCAMAFDSDGVLLATGDDRGSVHVYDFDDVCAMDLSKRNEMSRLIWEVKKSGKERKKWSSNGHSSDLENEGDDDDEDNKAVEEKRKKSLEMDMNSAPSIPPSIARPLISFTCGGRGGKFRISELQWNPDNQDQLVVSFANKQEIHIYDASSTQSPLPCLKLTELGEREHKEGISSFLFVTQATSPLKTSSSTIIITGGSYGSIRLWSIPKKGKQPLSSLNTKCLWSISVFSRREEGVGDMAILPCCSSKQMNTLYASNQVQRPIVLIGGNASSLVLLDTNNCTRKAFSTKITPTVLSSYDLSSLASRELDAIDPGGILPARRWMGVKKMSLMDYGCIDNISWYRVSVVVKCGWIFALEIHINPPSKLSSPSSTKSASSIRLKLLHKTPRIQCFNSGNERISSLGGMALQYSLPEIPIPSIAPCHTIRNMIWVGDVKMRTYTMPSKDKYTLSNTDISVVTPQPRLSHKKESTESFHLREPGSGLILVSLTSSPVTKSSIKFPSMVDDETELMKSDDGHQSYCIVARLPLSKGTPLSMAIHPSGEWMVVGYGMNGRGLSSRSLELISFRKIIQ